MMLSHVSFFLGLIALVSGVSLYLWSVRAEAGAGVALAKIVGIVVIVLAILGLICTLYSGLRRHKDFDSMMMKNCHCPMMSAPAGNAPAMDSGNNPPVAPTQMPSQTPAAPSTAPANPPAE